MLEQAELASKIRYVIETLPDIYREVFTLRDVEEFDVDEVAGLLQVTSNTVRVRLHRARAMMQKQLAPVLKDYTVPRRRRWFGGAQ